MEEQYVESRFVGDSQEENSPLHNVESEQEDEISPEVSNEGNDKPSTIKLLKNVNMEEQYAESRFVENSQEEISPLHSVESEQGNEISLEVGDEGNNKPSAIKRLKNWFFERKEKEFTNFTLIMTLVSMFSYGFDVGSDLLNAYSYYINRNNIENSMTYFVLTLVCTVVPSLLMHRFSLCEAWESLRKHRSQNTCKNNLHYFVFILTHILQVGLIYRFVRSIYFGRKLQKGKDEYYKKWIEEDENIVEMRLIETYLEAIPQLILQIYIMVTTGQVPIITVLACLGSVGGLSMAMRSFDAIPKEADYEDISLAETICNFLYQACSLLSRVLAFALLLNLNVWAGIGLLLLHWILATLFIFYIDDDFDDGCTGILICVILGFIFIFNFSFGFRGDDNFIRMAIVYFVENIIFAGFWFPLRPSVVNITDPSIGQTNSTIPPFTNSTIPPFTNSTIPPFTNSTIPPFTNSTIPPFNWTTTSEYVIPNNIAIVILVSIPALFILSLISLVILGRLIKRH